MRGTEPPRDEPERELELLGVRELDERDELLRGGV